jgi:hypothetical protein
MGNSWSVPMLSIQAFTFAESTTRPAAIEARALAMPPASQTRRDCRSAAVSIMGALTGRGWVIGRTYAFAARFSGYVDGRALYRPRSARTAIDIAAWPSSADPSSTTATGYTAPGRHVSTTTVHSIP